VGVGGGSRVGGVSIQRQAPAQANLTPMIDVVFQLIIFFLLVAQFSRQQSIELELPRVRSAEAGGDADESRAVVNVVPVDQVEAMGGAYRVGSLSFDATEEGVEAMAGLLRVMRERRPGLKVFIRADRREAYGRVHPAMAAVTLAGVGEMELVTAGTESGRR